MSIHNGQGGLKIMTLSQSILTAVFCIAIVFTVLAVLWALIRLFSVIITRVQRPATENVGTGKGKTNVR